MKNGLPGGGIRVWWGGCGDQGWSLLQRQPSRGRAEGDVGLSIKAAASMIMAVQFSAVKLSFATGTQGYLGTISTYTIRNSVILYRYFLIVLYYNAIFS
jgi:hypothetical protein